MTPVNQFNCGYTNYVHQKFINLMFVCLFLFYKYTHIVNEENNVLVKSRRLSFLDYLQNDIQTIKNQA